MADTTAKRNLRVSIDIDGCIINTHLYYIDWVNSEFHCDPPYTIDDISTWEFGGRARELGLTPKQCIGKIFEAYQLAWQSLRPVDESVVSVANYVLKRYDSRIVTANPEQNVIKALENLGVKTDRFTFSKDKTNGYDVVIEDDPTLKIKEGQYWLLRDRPYNQGVIGPGIVRITNSIQIPGILYALENGLLR